MKTQSVIDVISQGKAPIKEIHPENHSKIKHSFLNDVGGRVISVLVKPSDTITADKERIAQDNEYYDYINEDEFDIAFYYDFNSPPEVNALYFKKKMKADVMFYELFPRPGEVDKLNRKGYEAIASDFTEDKRITTRNFHELSEKFFCEMFSEYVSTSSDVLEIGPGQGWLERTVSPKCRTYVCIDIAEAMTKTIGNVANITTSVRCMDVASESFDVVVASLADPYFYPEAICEVNRILKNNGYFIFSLPASEWATALRGEFDASNKTSFVLSAEGTVEVYSLIHPEDKLNWIMDVCEFEGVKLMTASGAELSGKEISPAITKAAQSIGKEVNDLAIVTMAVYRKKGDINEQT